MNKRYKIEGTHLLYRLAEILFKVNLKTIAQFLKQNSAQLNIDWRGCNPQPRSGAASAIIGGGENINIFVFTDHKNNGFQKKLIMQNTKI
jgi:hypothetical protein